MSIAEKLTLIAENLSKVHAAGAGIQPSGSIEITENGTYDVTDKAEAVVEVPTYEEELNAQKAIEDSIIDGSITSYFNDRVTTAGTYAFGYRESLKSVEFPNLETVGNYAFYGCAALQKAKFQNAQVINNNGLRKCSALTKLILLNPNGCRLGGASGISETAIANGTGYVYVPDEIVENYKVATNWVTYADQIKPISELEGEA